jgi:hypothetical protein
MVRSSFSDLSNLFAQVSRNPCDMHLHGELGSLFSPYVGVLTRLCVSPACLLSLEGCFLFDLDSGVPISLPYFPFLLNGAIFFFILLFLWKQFDYP